MLLGVHLQLLIGPTVPVPAPAALSQLLQKVEVTQGDEGRSGFQITFSMGRSGPEAAHDYPLLANPLVRPFNRVVISVVFNYTLQVLMDGIITNHQVNPGTGPGTASLTLTGEDVSVMMDLTKKIQEHPAQPDPLVALKLIGGYAQYGLIPMIEPPLSLDVPNPVENTPVQHATDLEHLQELARRYAHVFYVEPGPLPLSNVAYWGPRRRKDALPQRALSVNLGAQSNVDSVSFQYDGLKPTLVIGKIQESQAHRAMPVVSRPIATDSLAAQPAIVYNGGRFRTVPPESSQGLTLTQALTRAQAVTDASLQEVVTANGSLDALRYGGLLKPRRIVGLRGAGNTYDGFYYVKRVTHTIESGTYKQGFSLAREGVSAIAPMVVP